MGKTHGVKASSRPKPKKAASTHTAPPFSARLSIRPSGVGTASDGARGDGSGAAGSTNGPVGSVETSFGG